ncbi:hypothetical protein HNQ36_000957 [Afipia massiliensis]|uniref:Uncharacterized protein n=2 Tax=Afipia massiliensis TaxID=211460 RepID=A0A840MSS1_9BRAD|nr:hypothetical protein [Afipia massiliensis]
MSELLTHSLEAAVTAAFEVISELADEMDAQFENAADWAQGSDANRSRLSASVTLGGVRRPSILKSLRAKNLQIEFFWKTERTRPDRLWNAVNCLEICIFHLSKLSGNDAAILKVELQQAVDAVKDTHFPPMFSKRGARKRRKNV